MQGGDKYKEASLVFKDLYDRHGPSSVAINGLASAYIAMRRFDDADKLLAVRACVRCLQWCGHSPLP